MGAYLSMLINRGATAHGRIASASGFDLFAHPHMPAKEFGSGAFYGYGIAVDRIDGHLRLKHTGGMVSFASALQVDMESGVGAFASINAMQGYRPNPVAEYALRLMRACRAGSAMPAPPAPNPALRVRDAARYAGRYEGGAGRALEIRAEGDRLYLTREGAQVPLEPAIEPQNAFTVLHPDYAHFALLFGSGSDADEGEAKGPFAEAGWGEEWFTKADYRGGSSLKVPDEWHGFAGHYRNEDPWIGSARIAIRNGKLWLNGVVPLEPARNGRFYLRDEADSPEWISFSDIVNGRAMRMRLSGADLQRS